MKIRLLSDLHLEGASFNPPPVDCDLVILAGDIHRGIEGIAWAKKHFSGPVIYVPGNHEHYKFGSVRENVAAMREAARGSNVHFLENESIEIGGVQFLGACLWSDFQVEAPRVNRRKALEAAANAMSDFVLCGWVNSKGKLRAFEPRDSLKLHEESRAWLEAQLAKPFAGKRVVVSHHLPSRQSIHPHFAGSAINGAFASDLEHLMPGVDAWCHGHTHAAVRAAVGGCRIYCNPRGYREKSEMADAPFDPHFVFEV